MVAYDELAAVYEWLRPDALLEPDGAIAAFAPVINALPSGGRVLDCAAGSGQLAVGLASLGFDVVASDASAAMMERTRRLASHHDVTFDAIVCAWRDLADCVEGRFDAVFCVGNSLTHAEGRAGRRAALFEMATVCRDGGLVVVTSRNWERLRSRRPGLEVDDHLTYRAGGAGLVVRAWTVPGAWDAPHHLDVAVVRFAQGRVGKVSRERLTFWPFTHQALHDDLRVVGFEPASSTYAPDADRYQITAVRSGRGGE